MKHYTGYILPLSGTGEKKTPIKDTLFSYLPLIGLIFPQDFPKTLLHISPFGELCKATELVTEQVIIFFSILWSVRNRSLDQQWQIVGDSKNNLLNFLSSYNLFSVHIYFIFKQDTGASYWTLLFLLYFHFSPKFQS